MHMTNPNSQTNIRTHHSIAHCTLDNFYFKLPFLKKSSALFSDGLTTPIRVAPTVYFVVYWSHIQQKQSFLYHKAKSSFCSAQTAGILNTFNERRYLHPSSCFAFFSRHLTDTSDRIYELTEPTDFVTLLNPTIRVQKKLSFVHFIIRTLLSQISFEDSSRLCVLAVEYRFWRYFLKFDNYGAEQHTNRPVSYTHLTLPTIYSV